MGRRSFYVRRFGVHLLVWILIIVVVVVVVLALVRR
jgi:flagellar basal body-associated protein FliL